MEIGCLIFFQTVEQVLAALEMEQPAHVIRHGQSNDL